MFFVYIIPYTNRRKQCYYCGHTDNPERRELEHTKRGFLGYRKKGKMVIISTHSTRSSAMMEEKRVKRLSRKEKQRLYLHSQLQ